MKTSLGGLAGSLIPEASFSIDRICREADTSLVSGDCQFLLVMATMSARHDLEMENIPR